MPCERIKIGGAVAIVCRAKARMRKCSCGQPGDRLCDWKLGHGKTCDAAICANCTTSPALDKDLCPAHQLAYSEWLKQRTAKECA